MQPPVQYTSQEIQKANSLSHGMSKARVSAVMGPAVKTEFSGVSEEWHYCRTGANADEFVALFFRSD